jgi:hypothetical protein
VPFTPAHAAAVVPLRRLGLPMGALVAGAVAPDLPLFLWSGGYASTHSPRGVVTLDVVVGLTLLALWAFLLRDAFADLTPWVRDRVGPAAPLGARAWLLAPVAVAVGALTHVVWDSATHPGRWIVLRVGWLQQEHAGLPGLKWAQYLSGVLGVAFVVGYAAWWLSRRPLAPRPSAVANPVAWLAAPLALAVAAGAVGFAVGSVLVDRAYFAAVFGIQAGALGALVVAAAWHVVVRRRTAAATRQRTAP